MNYVRASEKAPTSSFFTTDRDIVLDSSGRIPQGELLGTFTAADPDTAEENLTFSIVENSSPIAYDEDMDLAVFDMLTVEGNQLKVKDIGGYSISREALLDFSFTVNVSDKDDKSVTYVGEKSFTFNSRSIVETEDTTIRSDTSVLPTLDDSAKEPILFSATGTEGAITVQPGPVLNSEDLASVTDELSSSEDTGDIESITPLSPILNFSIETESPGEVVRFEFELPRLTIDKILETKYLKLSNGSLSIFDYITDEFGVSTGARLETRDSNSDYITDLSNYDPTDLTTEPIYLAVYVQDNGRGDDDPRESFITDPGGPASFGIREVALTLTRNSDPVNMTLPTLSDTDGDGLSSVEFVANREATYDNIVNFYRIANTTTGELPGGSVPSDADYVSLALTDTLQDNINSSPNLETSDLTETAFNLSFTPDANSWMPYVYVKATANYYFPYAAANSDGFAHFQQASNGGYTYLYVEDLHAGGDEDFDDIIIRVSTPT